MKILVIPDKFKGTLTASAAAEAIARGWRKARPRDAIEVLPMSDGGDGFGEAMGKLLGAKIQKVKTMDAAQRRCMAQWWWVPKTKIAVIESANVIGLAKLPTGKFHPFELVLIGRCNSFPLVIEYRIKILIYYKQSKICKGILN